MGPRRQFDGDGMNIRVGLMALDLDLMLGGGVGLDGARCRLDGDGMATGRAGWALNLVEWLDGEEGRARCTERGSKAMWPSASHQRRKGAMAGRRERGHVAVSIPSSLHLRKIKLMDANVR